MSGNYNNRNNGPRNVLGAVAGTGFRTLAAAVARKRRRGGDRGDSDDEYFENPNRLNNNRNNNNRRNNNNTNNNKNARNGRRNNANNRGGRTSSNYSRHANSSRHSNVSNLSASVASSRSNSPGDSYYSSDDSHPNRSTLKTRSVHSRSTFSTARRSYTTRSSVSAYSDSNYSDDSYSDDGSSYSRSTRSYSRSHATGTTTHQNNKSTAATGTFKDNRSTLRGTYTSAPSASVNYLSSRRSTSRTTSAAGTRTTGLRRDRSAANSDAHSYGGGSSSDSADNARYRDRSRTPPTGKHRVVNSDKMAVAAVLDAAAAGGFECLIEDPAKQPTTKRAKRATKKDRRSQMPSHSRRVGSKSVDRSQSAPGVENGDEAISVIERKEQAAEYRLNVPMLQRFCTEFSAPFGFATAEAETFAQQKPQDALGKLPAISVDESTGVPLNTKNAVNGPLMASIVRAVNFVLLQAPQYPSEMVRALLWRVVQSSKGPHDRLGAWKLLDGVLRCLHRRMTAYLKREQALKIRESTIQQSRHEFDQAKAQRLVTDDDADSAEAEADRQFYADISQALSLIDSERLTSRKEIRWVKIMLSEFAQLLPYLILYCWGGEKSAAFKFGAVESRAAAKRLAKLQRQQKEASTQQGAQIQSNAPSANSLNATASNASEDDHANGLLNSALAADLDVVKRRVFDFVAGRVHGDGTMTERGQHHHATLLRHHHTLDNLAASTQAPRNTITTQSRFAVGNGMHLTTSKAKPLVTEQELAVINQQIFAEYELILRGWGVLFHSPEKYYISYIHIRRAVGDYAALLSDHDAAASLRMGAAAKSISKHREGSELYHFALKASHLKSGSAAGERSLSQQLDTIYLRQREVFENFLLPPARMVDSLWRFRRAEPRPSLVSTVLAQFGFPLFKAGSAAEDSAIYSSEGAAGRRADANRDGNDRPEDNVVFSFPKTAEEVSINLGFPINDRLAAWIRKAAEHAGGCLCCDSWTHNFNSCPYRPNRFVGLNRQIVASLSAAEAVDLLKSVAGRSYTDRNVATATLAALAGGGVSADRAGSDATTQAGISQEQQGAARKQLVMDVLDAAAERCASKVEMDSILNALDVILRQSSTGRERQALSVLASYRLQPSKMIQFTNAASNSVAPITSRNRRKQNVVDFGRNGRTPAAEKLLAFLNQENRYYESARLRSAMEILYFRYTCIPHNDAVMVQQLQRDINLIRENRCFVDVLNDDEAPLQSRIFAVTPKSVLAASINRVKRVAHMLDPCTLELSPCCAGAAVDSIRAYNAQHNATRDPHEATEPWDWFVARQVLKSERLISQHDGLAMTMDDLQSKYQRMSELIERLQELAEGHDRREDGRLASSRLRLVAFLIDQCGFCTSCNRFGHTRRTCAELASTLIFNNLSTNTKRELGITSITTARIAVPSMPAHIRTLQATRHRARDDQKADIDRDIRSMTELIGLLGGPQEAPKGKGGKGFNQRAPQIPAAVVLIARRAGGVRSGQIDLGSTATSPALPPSVGMAIRAITAQTGLTLAEVRFCPDECLALFHAAAYHHITPHITAFRARQFPNLVISTNKFEDDAFDERAAQDRMAGATVTSDLSTQTLAQLSNPSARRRHREYALPDKDFSGIAIGFDGMGRTATTVLSEGLLRALNAQQLCRDRYLDLASFLMRTTGSGSVDSEGACDYETVYSLFFPQTVEGRAVRQQLVARGRALHDELFRRIQVRIPAVNPNAPISQRPYGTVYELERDYFLRNLTSDTDKSSYTFYAAVQCRNNMAARIRRFTQERAVPLPGRGGPAAAANAAPMHVPPMMMMPSQTTSYSAPHSQGSSYAAPLLPPLPMLGTAPPSQSSATGGSLPPPPPAGMLFGNFPPPSSIAFRGRLSSGLLMSQPAAAASTTANAAAAAAEETSAAAAAADAIEFDDDMYTAMGNAAAAAPTPSSSTAAVAAASRNTEEENARIAMEADAILAGLGLVGFGAEPANVESVDYNAANNSKAASENNTQQEAAAEEQTEKVETIGAKRARAPATEEEIADFAGEPETSKGPHVETE